MLISIINVESIVVFIMTSLSLCSVLRPEGGGGGGGVKVDFPVFTYFIRAAGDEQEEKNRT